MTAVPTKRLTAKQVEIFQLVADGMSRKEIASKMKLTTRTIEAHCYNSYNVLGVKSVPHAVAELFRKGLIK